MGEIWQVEFDPDGDTTEVAGELKCVRRWHVCLESQKRFAKCDARKGKKKGLAARCSRPQLRLAAKSRMYRVVPVSSVDGKMIGGKTRACSQ